MRTVSCYGYATHGHISLHEALMAVPSLLLRLWTPGGNDRQQLQN